MNMEQDADLPQVRQVSFISIGYDVNPLSAWKVDCNMLLKRGSDENPVVCCPSLLMPKMYLSVAVTEPGTCCG